MTSAEINAAKQARAQQKKMHMAIQGQNNAKVTTH